MFPGHMLSHILSMNVAAPLAAVLVARAWPGRPRADVAVLAGLSILQVALLIGWHMPPVMTIAMHDTALGLFMHLSLFAAALAFWRAVFDQAAQHLWRALIALLVTGKVYCLMAALLVFAPRVLYPEAMVALADQQLAGVMMVVACPLSYVAVATVLAARWLSALGLGAQGLGAQGLGAMGPGGDGPRGRRV